MYIGYDEIQKIYVGTEDVSKIYLGYDLIYEESTPAPTGETALPLTFDIESDGEIKWRAQVTAYTCTIEYSKNGGEWTSITSATGTSAPSISVVSGDTIQFRGDNASYALTASSYNHFQSVVKFNVHGNIMSLINSTDYASLDTLESAFTFYRLFESCTKLTDASNLVLPATGLTEFCYNGMFQGCTNLTSAPELPATTLARNCYQTMFSRCTSLTYIKCLATNISATSCTNGWVNGVAATGTFIKNPNMSSWTTGVNGIPSGWVALDGDEENYVIIKGMRADGSSIMSAVSIYNQYGIERSFALDCEMGQSDNKLRWVQFIHKGYAYKNLGASEILNIDEAKLYISERCSYDGSCGGMYKGDTEETNTNVTSFGYDILPSDATNAYFDNYSLTVDLYVDYDSQTGKEYIVSIYPISSPYVIEYICDCAVCDDCESECMSQGKCWDGANCIDCAEYDCLQQGGCWDGVNCNECE